MRIFTTGASGFIGSALVPELFAAGHTVVGLTRSNVAADALSAAGEEAQPGSLDDVAALRVGAEASTWRLTMISASSPTPRRPISALPRRSALRCTTQGSLS